MNFYILDVAFKLTFDYLNGELTDDQLIRLLNKLSTFVDDEEE